MVEDIEVEPESKCPFCNSSETLISNKYGFVRYDKYPVTNGHCLIIPHRHFSDYFNSTDQEKIAMLKLIDETKVFLDEKYNPTGYNIGINIGETAGQTVMHLHIHLIPRYDGDTEDPKGGVRGVIANKQKY